MWWQCAGGSEKPIWVLCQCAAAGAVVLEMAGRGAGGLLAVWLGGHAHKHERNELHVGGLSLTLYSDCISCSWGKRTHLL